MSEFERDPQVADLLITAASEAGAYIRPRGVDAVVRTVRWRRTRMVGVAVLVVAAIAAPLAVLGDRHASHSPVGNPPSTNADPASSGPAPSGSASSLPSSSPSEPAAVDGRIPVAQLRNSTLQIPAWPKGWDADCPTGAVKFTSGKAGQNHIEALQGVPVYVDVDRDGAQETIVIISCSPQGNDYQVLALDRDTTGNVVTLGKVVGSAGNTGKEGSDIMTIWAIAAASEGQVRVDVGEYRPCCETPQVSQHQWRTYGWNGNRFTQTGGPTAFGPNPKVTDLVITADPLTMIKQGDGSWAGTLRVSIHNAAIFATPGELMFALSIDASWQPQSDTQCRFKGGGTMVNCTLPSLDAGANRVLTLHITAPAGSLSTRCTVYASAVGYPDRKPGGASATVKVVEG